MFFTTVSSTLGCFIILIISHSINRSKTLEWFGRKTLPIYCMQFTVYQAILRIMSLFSFDINTINCVTFILTLMCLGVLILVIGESWIFKIKKDN